MTQLQWLVYHRSSRDKMGTFNVFNSHRFMSSLINICLEEGLDFEKFNNRINSAAIYSFWCKYEYEVGIVPFPPCISMDKYYNIKDQYNQHKEKYHNEPKYLYATPDGFEKIDAYGQLQLNWDCFVKYIWENKDVIKKMGEESND